MVDRQLLRHSANITAIPENLVLEIFRYLPVKDLCTAGRVCRSWRRVVRDNSLWRHVDLLPYKINLRQTWKVIRTHFSDILLSLRLRGYMDKTGVSWTKNSLSDAMLRDLTERCPSMKTLDLVCTNLTPVTLANFPQPLEEIFITQSLIPNGWFLPMSKEGSFPKLRLLDLRQSTKTNDADLNHITAKINLTALKLGGCYRVTEKGLRSVAESQKDLEVLDISETQCTDLALHHIGRNLTKLNTLDISKCSKVTNSGIGVIGACLINLECLDLDDCPGVTTDCLNDIRKLKKLKNCHLLEKDVKKRDDPASD